MILPASALEDTNANGLSDFFERRFNVVVFPTAGPEAQPGGKYHPDSDPDGDGMLTCDEAVFATDPFSPEPPGGLFKTRLLPSDPATPRKLSLDFPSVLHKCYTPEISNNLEDWIPLEPIEGTGAPLAFATETPLEPKNFLRLRVSDFVSDGDSLNDWEESVLGTDPSKADTDSDGDDDGVDSDPLVNPYAADPDGLGIPAPLKNGDLIGRWDFENVNPIPNPSDLSWGTALFPDKSGNGRNGGAVNTIIDPLGMPSKAADLQRGFVGIPPSLLASRAIYTVSLWAKLPSDAIPAGQTAAGIFSNHTVQTVGTSNRRYVNALYVTVIGGVGKLRAGAYIYNSNPLVTSFDGVEVSGPPGTWTDDRWHHYLYVCNDAQVRLYRDGVLLGTDTYVAADIHPDSALSGVSIGRFYGPAMGTIGNQSFNSTGVLKGRIDRVRVWKKPLTAADALALYKEDVSGDGIDDLRAVNSRLWRDNDSDATRGQDEYQFLLDPFIRYGPQHDVDGDGVSNLDEIALGLNPSNPDTDGDLLPDGWERNNALDPKAAFGPDGATGDPDADGYNNITEYGNKTNPGDASSGSMDDIPDEDVIAFKLGVGDRSGSQSEDYTMECYEFDPATNTETPVYTLRSGGFGQYTEKTVGKPFRRGRSYSFKLNWQSSNLAARPANPGNGTTAEGPDYDYHFVVEPQGGHGGMIMDGYDIRAKRFDIARKILDPGDVEPYSDDDDDIPDLPNYFGHMRTLFRTLMTGGQLITPGGDPVNNPVDSGDGANEFTFSTAAQGVLTINLKAKPKEGLPFDVDIAGKFKFQLDDIPGSTLTWSSGNDGGKARKSGAFMIATATFTGLPADNSAFGKKTARLMAEGQQCDAKEYEIFFSKTGTNHPGGQANSPNWYHYWLQTPANKTNTTVQYSASGGPSTYILASHTIFMRNDSSLKQRAWGHPQGIDCFAWTTGHEAKHHTQLSEFWPSGYNRSNDTDDDNIPNDKETIYMPGRNYDPANGTTFPDLVEYGKNPIPDSEDIAMRSQTAPYNLDILWTDGAANDKDWANPGKNSKEKY